MDKPENIQSRTTRLVPRLKRKNYEHKITELELTTLEIRRKRGDLIQFFKILKNIDKVEFRNKPSETFQGSNNRPAGNLMKKEICFDREPANIETLRDEFFTNRVIPLWYDLPLEVKEAKTVNSFKTGLDGQSPFSTKLVKRANL